VDLLQVKRTELDVSVAAIKARAAMGRFGEAISQLDLLKDDLLNRAVKSELFELIR
jgi:hypothetical protein